MISTHWRVAREPESAELRALDVLARIVADLIERARAEEALHLSEGRFATFFARSAAAMSIVRLEDGR
jgi:hypothetical protein